VEATIVQRGPAGKRSEKAGLFEPVVGPTGEVIRAPVNTTLKHPGLCLVTKAHGQLLLTEHATRHGYTFYRDMCLYGIPAEGVEPSPVHWQIYMKLCEMKDANQVPSTPLKAAEMYHPEVARRRAADHAGVTRIDDDAMTEILQGIRDRHEAETPEIREAARAAGLKVPEPKSDEGLGELLARAKRGKGGD
jgi:hypothetical protein